MIKIGSVKAEARHSLDGRLFGRVWVMLVVCALIGGIMAAVPSFLGSFLSALTPALGALLGMPLALCSVIIRGPVSYSMARIYHRVARGDKDIKVKDLFVGFKECAAESILLSFLRGLFIALWCLLLIVPGIVKSYAYSMAFYIQQESKGQKNWRTCLDESDELTRGYKGKLFLMDLSFIGWYILGYLCLGIGVLWVAAYHQESYAHFYEELKRVKGISGDDESAEDGGCRVYTDDRSDDDVFGFRSSHEDRERPARIDRGDVFDFESDEREKRERRSRVGRDEVSHDDPDSETKG